MQTPAQKKRPADHMHSFAEGVAYLNGIANLKNKAIFPDAVDVGIRVVRISAKELGDEYGQSVAAVGRWAAGEGEGPSPAARESILTWMQARANQALADLNKPQA